MTNILYHEGKPYVTDKETLPEKPDKPESVGKWTKEQSVLEEQRAYFGAEKKYNQALTDFIRDHCSPIVEKDWEKVRMIIINSVKVGDELTKRDFKYYPVDHTIYKVELELSEVEQVKTGDGRWVDRMFSGNDYRLPSREYRRAFRVVETKTK